MMSCKACSKTRRNETKPRLRGMIRKQAPGIFMERGFTSEVLRRRAIGVLELLVEASWAHDYLQTGYLPLPIVPRPLE